MVKVEFTKDYATRKKGETWECDSMLASKLVRIFKVAKFWKEKPLKTKKK